MFKATLSPAKDASSIPSDTETDPVRAQKEWPPDFSKLNSKQQFRLERRYRRRAKLKYSQPGWIKRIKLTSWVACSTIFVYGVLFMDWGTEKTPFRGIRNWARNQANSFWTAGSIIPPLSTTNEIRTSTSAKGTDANQ